MSVVIALGGIGLLLLGAWHLNRYGDRLLEDPARAWGDHVSEPSARFSSRSPLDRGDLLELPYSASVSDQVALAALDWIRGLPERAT